MKIKAIVVDNLVCDLLWGVNNMWRRADGRNVSLLANNEAGVCDIRIGDRTFRAKAGALLKDG